MLNWLFGKKEKEVEEVEVSVVYIEEDLTEDTSEVTSNISEPIYSFVECVKNNPKRFKFEKETSQRLYDEIDGIRMWKLTDLFTEDVFIVTIKTGRNAIFDIHLSWVSVEEEEYIKQELYAGFYLRQVRLQRKIRQKLERRKYKEIYCKKSLDDHKN